MKQLYAWTFDDAWKAQEEWETRWGGNIRGRGPFWRWAGSQELKELFGLYKTGNSAAIIEALYVCSFNSLPIPRWCEMAFLASYRKVRHFKAKSWDDVFGRPHKKGTHLETKAQERKYPLRVYYKIREILRDEPSTPIDGALFERVGREFGIGSKTLIEGYYYKEKNKHRTLEAAFNKNA